MVSDEQIIVDYEYYQGRRDRLFLDKDGKFLYVTGVPSDDPTEPEPVKDALKYVRLKFPLTLTM